MRFIQYAQMGDPAAVLSLREQRALLDEPQLPV